MEIYQHKPEVWNEAKCRKMANRLATDGLGTKYPFKGYIGCSTSCPPAFGEIRYNGGCIRDGKWYDGENRPLPILAPGFEIVVVPSWGWRIRQISHAVKSLTE